MANTNLRALVAHYASDQEAIIDHLTNASGILETGLTIPSSHGSFHKYKKIDALPTADIRAMDGTYTERTVNANVEQTDLKIFGIAESEEKDICEEIGVSQYFKSQRPAIVESIGQKMATALVYGNNASYGHADGIIGFHQYADANGSNFYTDAGGGDANTTTIFVVRWKTGINAILFNSKILAGGELIQTQILNQGDPVFKYGGSSGTVKPVYQALYEAQMGLVAGSKYFVHAIVGIDSSNDVTAAELNKAIDSVKATAADSFIYTSRMGRRSIWTLKDSNMYEVGSHFDDRLDRWNGIPIVLDENINEDDTLSNLPYGL